jgi:hypothetical protein
MALRGVEGAQRPERQIRCEVQKNVQKWGKLAVILFEKSSIGWDIIIGDVLKSFIFEVIF